MKRHVLAFLLAMALCLALLALFTGVLGDFTSEPPPPDHNSLRVTTDERWDTSDLFLALGDRLERSLVVTNEDSVAMHRLTLSAEVRESAKGQLNLSEALMVTLQARGATVAGPTPLSDFADVIVKLDEPLEPGATLELSVTYRVRLPRADQAFLANELQGSEAAVRFSAEGYA